MRTDAYTKAMLTVIALALIWLVVRDGSPLVAQTPSPTRVVIVGVEGDPASVPVRLVAVERGQSIRKREGKEYSAPFPWEALNVAIKPER
jgi:hypothetical protein